MKIAVPSLLLGFRERAYQQFSRRADALFEMLDALFALPTVTAPAHMMMLPGFQRRWGSVYDALSAGRIHTTGVEDLVAQYPLNGGESVYAVDSSTWMKNDAETSPQRGYYHHHNRHSAGKPIVAGWSYQWLAQVSFRHDSWCAPLSARRVEPTDNMHHVAATQIRALLERRQHHTEMPIFVFDAGYDAVQLAHLLGNEPLGLLVRLHSNRCFYAEPDAHQPQGPRGYKDQRPGNQRGVRLRPRDEWVMVPVPVIIDPETWQAAQEQLLVNRQRSTRNNTAHDYLLRGLVVCGQCHRRMVGSWNKAGGRYVCSARYPRFAPDHCDGRSIMAPA